MNNETGIPMQIVFYGGHTPPVDSTILSVGPRYLIDNPTHGLWGEVSGFDAPWLLHDVARFQAEKIKVIGYLTAGYEGKGSRGGLASHWCTLETNRRLIRNMASRDGVNGIFIDECSRFPDRASRNYLKELGALAHDSGLMVWGNVGADDFDEWFLNGGGFDMMNASENWMGQALTPIEKEWGNRISVTGFHPAYTATDAYRLVCAALDKGLALAYITNDEYLSLPTWINEVASLLRTA